MGFFSKLAEIHQNDKQAQREHEQKMAQIASQTQIIINGQNSSTKKFTSAVESGSDVAKTYITHKK